MFKWLKRYINNTAATESEAALRIYCSIIIAARPLTAQELESTGVKPEHLKELLAICVRNRMLDVDKRGDEQTYVISPASYEQVKKMLMDLQVPASARARVDRQFADDRRFRNKGPRSVR